MGNTEKNKQETEKGCSVLKGFFPESIKSEERCDSSSNFVNNPRKDNNLNESESTVTEFSSFAISKANRVITRQFLLIPTNAESFVSTYNELDSFFLQLRILQNKFIQVLNDKFSDGTLSIVDFRETNKSFIAEHIYNKLNLNLFSRAYFSERIVRCAIDPSFQAYRNWLIRNNNLSVISNYLRDTFLKFDVEDKDIDIPLLCCKSFLNGSLRYEYLEDLRTLLIKNFENLFSEVESHRTPRQNFSYFVILNLTRKLKNIFFSEYRSELNALLIARLAEFRLSNFKQDLNKFFTYCISDFYRTEKWKKIYLNPNELPLYFLDLYFFNLKRMDTRGLKRHLLKSGHSDTDLKKFLRQNKKTRDLNYKLLKVSFKALVVENNKNDSEIINTFSLIFHKYLEFIDCNSDISLSNLVFNPSYRSFRFDAPSYDHFLEFVRIKLINKLIEHFVDLFLTEKILNFISNKIAFLKKRFSELDNKLIELPEIKEAFLPISNNDVYLADYEASNGNFTFTLKHKPYKSIQFNIGTLPLDLIKGEKKEKSNQKRIVNQQKRFNQIINSFHVKIHHPTLTYKNKKLILHLPFEVEKKSNLQDNIKNIEMGIDLNLTVFAVLSIMKKSIEEKPKEIARYFLDQKKLFYFKFIDGKFVKRGHFKSNTPNIKRRLISIRKTIKNIQLQIANYKNNIIEEKGENYDFNSDTNYKKLDTILSSLWNRVNNINNEIVRLVSHNVIKIAKYHHVSKIKVEDLRFSSHSKRQKVGGFLAFWQVHWLFSSIQSAIELQAYLNGILFERVNASYTSQRCSICGEIGVREGKIFRCDRLHCVFDRKLNKYIYKPIQLDANLNAARNITITNSQLKI